MRTRVRKILRGLGRILLGLALLLGLLWLLRIPLFGGLVKRELTSRIETALGGRYEIEGVGGTWIGGLRIDGLRTLEAPPDGPLTGLSVDQAEIDYDLLGLFGDTPLAAIDAVRVDGATLQLDLTRPPAQDAAEGPDLAALEVFRGRVDAALDVIVDTGDGQAALRGLQLAVGPGHPLELRIHEVVLPEQLDVRGPLAGRVARVDADTWRWTSDAELAGVRVPDATIRRDGRVTATVEVAGGRILATSDAEQLTARVEAVDLSRLPDVVVAQVSRDLELPTSGRVSGSVVLPWGGRPLATSFDLAIEDLVWLAERIGVARVRGSSAGDRLTLAELEVTGERVRASGRDVLVDLARPIPFGGARSLSIDVDSLRTFLPDLEHDVSVALRAVGPESDRLIVQRLTLFRGEDRVEASGEVRFPEDPDWWRRTAVDLTFDGVVADPATYELPWTGSVQLAGLAVGALDELALEIHLAGETIAVEGRPVEGAQLVGTLRWPEIEVSKLEVRAPGVVVDASGRASIEPLRFTDATWRLAVDDLAQVAALLPEDVPPLAGRLRSEGRLGWDGEAATGTADATVTGLRVDDENIGTATVSLAADSEGAVRIRALDASGPWGRVRGTATVELRTESATVDGLAWSEAGESSSRAMLRAPLRMLWSGGVIRLAGVDLDVDGARVRFDGSVHPEGHDAQILRLEIEHPDLRLRTSEIVAVAWAGDVVRVPDLTVVVNETLRLQSALSVDLAAESATVDTLEVESEELEARLLAPLRVVRRGDEFLVQDLDGIARGMRFRGTGRLDLEAETAVVEALRVWDGELDARLEAPARLAWRDDGLSAEGLDVVAWGGRVRGRASWDGVLHAELDARGFALGQWVEALEGQIAARVRVDGERLAVEAEIPELALQDWRGAFQVRAVQDASGPLRVEHVRLSGPRGGALEGAATLPWRLSQSGLVTVEGAQAELDLRGRLGGLDRFTDVADGPVSLSAEGDEEGLRVLLRVADVGLCDETKPCDDVALDLRITPEAVKGRIALGSDAFLRVRGHLDLDRGFDWTHPETVADLIAEATVDGQVDAVVESWAPLASVAPGLRRLAGATRLQLRAQGPLRAPSVEGSLVLSRVGVEFDTDVAPFEQVDARLVWKDDVIRVEQLEGLMGYAPFSIQGDVRLQEDSLPVLDLTLQGQNTQLIRTEWFRMRIDIDGRVTGPVDRMHVEGEGRIVDSIYREPVSLTGASGVGDAPELILFEIEDAPFDQMTFDLGVRADRTIHIRNNLLRVDVSFDGRLKGTGARPAIEGRATFDNMEIQLPLTTLRDGVGKIEFLPGSPGRPRIQMTAGTRTKGYEMGVQVAGRLPDVNLHVFTEPILDDEDAMLMLATGSTSAELAQGGIMGKALAGVVSIFGGSLFTSRGDEGEPGQKAFFERFEVSGDLDGSDIRELDAEFELDRRFYLHLKRDRFEATNFGLIWRMRFR